ncbi:MAG TPA: MFS transporter [Acidimicrobiales bacterium]|nr:MFS transporter [Acidimicrobiales bacterium]
MEKFRRECRLARSDLVSNRVTFLTRKRGPEWKPLPRPFWFVWAGTLVNRICYFVEPFLALYLARSLRFSTETIGVVLTAFGVGSAISQPLGGFLADRIGRRTTMAAGMVATAASFGFLVFARGLGLIAVAAFVTGVAIDIYRPAVGALVADLVPSENRRRAFAQLYWAVNLGVSVAGVLGGYLASHSFHLLFALDAATCLVFAFVITKGVPNTPVPAAPPGERGGYSVVFRDLLLIAIALTVVVESSVYAQSFLTLPLAMRASGLGPQDYGIAYTVNPVAVIVLQPLTLRLLTRLPMAPVFAGSAVLLGAGFGLDAFAHSLFAYAATVLVWTLGEIGFNAVAPALIADIAPAHLRGRYNGTFGLAFGISGMIAPLAGTSLLSHLGRSVLWGSCFGACAIAGVASLALGPAIRRRLASESTVPAG